MSTSQFLRRTGSRPPYIIRFLPYFEGIALSPSFTCSSDSSLWKSPFWLTEVCFAASKPALCCCFREGSPVNSHLIKTIYLLLELSAASCIPALALISLMSEPWASVPLQAPGMPAKASEFQTSSSQSYGLIIVGEWGRVGARDIKIHLLQQFMIFAKHGTLGKVFGNRANSSQLCLGLTGKRSQVNSPLSLTLKGG